MRNLLFNNKIIKNWVKNIKKKRIKIRIAILPIIFEGFFIIKKGKIGHVLESKSSSTRYAK